MPGFDYLSPQIVLSAVEAAFGMELQSVVTPFPSYVNRVFGMSDAEGTPYVVKFYRPGRWSREALLEEHRFLEELAREELPVVQPLKDVDGDTLAEVLLERGNPDEDDIHFHFALFPKRSGRLFDAEGDEAWLRIGALCGHMHSIGSQADAVHRQHVSPGKSTSEHIEYLLKEGVIPSDMLSEFSAITDRALSLITPVFQSIPFIRLHGDLHRGNILDRGDEGLLLIDLDDMSTGPAMQDFWLLMPERYGKVGKEMSLLAEGYENFRPFPWNQTALMEPLRFMRMIHFIAWCGRQRRDRDFRTHFPGWGDRSWWIQELEDLRDQVSVIESGLNQVPVL
jgi:Ser/Thr protein kinase RdoA (MazF antagonist)